MEPEKDNHSPPLRSKSSGMDNYWARFNLKTTRSRHKSMSYQLPLVELRPLHLKELELVTDTEPLSPRLESLPTPANPQNSQSQLKTLTLLNPIPEPNIKLPPFPDGKEKSKSDQERSTTLTGETIKLLNLTSMPTLKSPKTSPSSNQSNGSRMHDQSIHR